MNIKIDKIIYSQRKTLAMQVTPQGELIIKAPVGTNADMIDFFIKKHSRWLQSRVKNLISAGIFKEPSYTEGEKFNFFGKKYSLKFYKGTKTSLSDKYLLVPEKLKMKIKDVIYDFYKKTAYEYLKKRVNYFAEKYNFTYNLIKISSAKKRWGSCSAKKNINFSWRLIMAPAEIIDYVIVHELAHTKQMNHSKDFWKIIMEIIPDFKQRKKWLDENGHLLNL